MTASKTQTSSKGGAFAGNTTAQAQPKQPKGSAVETNTTAQVQAEQSRRPQQNSAFYDNHQARTTLMNNRTNAMATPVKPPVGNAMTARRTINNNPVMMNQNNIRENSQTGRFAEFIQSPVTETNIKGYQMHDERLKTGNVFSPSNVLDRMTERNWNFIDKSNNNCASDMLERSVKFSPNSFENNPKYQKVKQAAHEDQIQRETNTKEWFRKNYNNGETQNQQIVEIPITDKKVYF